MKPKDILSLISREKGYSINALAKKVEIDRGSLNNLMQGKTKKISFNIASHIVAAFPEYRLEWLLTGEGDPYNPSEHKNMVAGENNGVVGDNGKVVNITTGEMDTLKERCARLEGENKILREQLASIQAKYESLVDKLLNK